MSEPRVKHFWEPCGVCHGNTEGHFDLRTGQVHVTYPSHCTTKHHCAGRIAKALCGHVPAWTYGVQRQDGTPAER